MINQEDSYGVFETSGSVILGITKSTAALYGELNRSTLLLAFYLTCISLIMIVCISAYIDRYIVDGISSIHEKLERITRGNLDTRVEVDSTPEFGELSFQINQMVVYMLRVKKAFSFDKMFAVIFLISAISLLLMWAVERLQKLCMPWEAFQRK